ncbi:MAG TPA: hypothetical protein VK138_13290 [Acidiferrobacterales bacterium]|nr:hypothetical protein [Acidiferrobacterales bacterium]
MKQIYKFISSASKVRALIAQAEAAAIHDPSMAEVAGLVYVGDIYSLRKEVTVGKDDGWGKRRYVGSFGVPGL